MYISDFHVRTNYFWHEHFVYICVYFKCFFYF